MGYKIRQIEEELGECINSEKSRWVRMYRLMDTVEQEKLYTERHDTPSFTSWVNALATEQHIHVSLLWQRLKAGRVYAEYAEWAKARGEAVPELEEIDVPAESLSLCKTVAGKDMEQRSALIRKVVAGDLTRDDLRAAARARRGHGGEVAVNRYAYKHINDNDADGNDSGCGEAGGEGKVTSRRENDAVTAADILTALRKSTWLQPVEHDVNFDYIYQAFSEFRADSGSSRYARRLDALVVDNLTENRRNVVTLRGIEIKVSKHDLLRDTKMMEYTEFVDLFYIAVPEIPDMIEAAEAIRHSDWGLMTTDRFGKIKVIREPSRLHPAFREKTLSNIIMKLAAQVW